jgi:hypothetical protein
VGGLAAAGSAALAQGFDAGQWVHVAVGESVC